MAHSALNVLNAVCPSLVLMEKMMASFRKRSGKWQVRIQRQDFPDQCKTFLLRSDAESWARKTEISLDKGQLNSNNPHTALKELLHRYKKEVTPKKKFSSVEMYRVNAWLKHPLANYSINKIRNVDIAKWRDERILQKKAPNTIRLELAVISHLYTIAKNEWGYESLINPTLQITLPKLPNGRTRRISSNELDLILKNTNSILLRPIVIFAIETAMRRSEIASLEWKHLDLENRTILLPETKNGDARKVPLSNLAINQIMLMKNNHPTKIFNITAHAITIAFRRTCKRSGIEELPFHTLRHEAVSRFFEKGFSLAEVAAISGHKTWSMLKRYTHLKAENLVSKLD
jgi:hypothetical protein